MSGKSSLVVERKFAVSRQTLIGAREMALKFMVFSAGVGEIGLES